MKYMLDTNICSYIIKNRPLEVLARFNTLQVDDCCISSITYAELKYWVAKNKRLHVKSQNPGMPKINEQVINSFVSHLDIIEFDAHAADVYADIRDIIDAKGLMVGNADLLIGAHAISLSIILVTNNSKDFMHFPSIQLENWVST
jgi:tRNA(fMet)-specific endonuclease VapC